MYDNDKCILPRFAFTNVIILLDRHFFFLVSILWTIPLFPEDSLEKLYVFLSPCATTPKPLDEIRARCLPGEIGGWQYNQDIEVNAVSESQNIYGENEKNKKFERKRKSSFSFVQCTWLHNTPLNAKNRKIWNGRKQWYRHKTMFSSKCGMAMGRWAHIWTPTTVTVYIVPNTSAGILWIIAKKKRKLKRNFLRKLCSVCTNVRVCVCANNSFSGWQRRQREWQHQQRKTNNIKRNYETLSLCFCVFNDTEMKIYI
jgi:hypothetical protein